MRSRVADAHPESAWLANATGLAWGTEEPEDHAEAAKWFRKGVEAAPTERVIVDNYAVGGPRSPKITARRRSGSARAFFRESPYQGYPTDPPPPRSTNATSQRVLARALDNGLRMQDHVF